MATGPGADNRQSTSFSGPECHREALVPSVLPTEFRPYIDKYFLRSEQILKEENLNPWVVAQVMIRKGPGAAHGIDEAIAMIEKYTKLKEHGGQVYALEEGSTYQSGETLLHIEGPILDIIALETMYLGVLSSETTRHTDGLQRIDLKEAEEHMQQVVAAADGRPVSYFGARHWRYDQDMSISQAAFKGGATSCSTDAGAATVGQSGMGTIPHVLMNIYAWKVGRERAVEAATLAFDKYIDRSVPRIALPDYNNREIQDSLATARALNGNLAGVRIDTCGENIAEGALISPTISEARDGIWRNVQLPALDEPRAKYWYGRGVTVTGVYALRRALDATGFYDVKIILSSGFGDTEKVKAFVDAEKQLGRRLFDGLGVGGIFESRAAKMDIVMVGEDREHLTKISKVGRGFKENRGLKAIWPTIQ